MLKQNPQEEIMKQVRLYTRPLCGWCIDAKTYLSKRGISYEEVDVGVDRSAYQEMERLSGQRYVPTIVVDGEVLANFDTDQLDQFIEELKHSQRS